MGPTTITLMTFGAGALAVAGIYSLVLDLFLRDRTRVSQRLDEEFRKKPRGPARKSQLFKDLGKLGAEAGKEARSSFREGFREWVDQSGLSIAPSRLLLLTAATALALGSLGWLLVHVIAGAALGAVGLAAPLLYVHVKRKKRLDQMMAQLPDAFDLIARLIRAGKTVAQAFQGVAEEFRPPLGSEFAFCYEQQNLGLPPDIALRDLARRVGLVEIKIFVLAVLVQRQTGGNLAELIDNLAATVRERFRIRGKIRVLTAEGRMEASVLLALPPVVFLMILFLNRNYALVLLEHPNMIAGMLGLMLVGFLWIRRIINFEF